MIGKEHLAFCALALSLCAGLHNVASAQSIEDARSQYLEAEFHESMESFETILLRPEVTHRQALEAHRYLATLKAMLGSKKSSKAHVRAALALDAKAQPAPGSPRTVVDAFSITREEFGGRSAEIAIEGVRDRKSRIVTATLDPSPSRLADRISIRCHHEGQASGNVSPLPSVSVTVPTTEPVECQAKVVTGGGAVLMTKSADVGDNLPGLSPIGSDGRRSDGSAKKKKWPWIVAVVGALAVGGTVTGIMLAKNKKSNSVKLTGVTVNWD